MVVKVLNSMIVVICVSSNDYNTSKSLSPVIKKSALASFASDNKKLSFGSRHNATDDKTEI
jgi:hypothetical protein